MIIAWLRPLFFVGCATLCACSLGTDSSLSGAATSITASPLTVTADGVQTSTVTVLLRAARGNPLADIPVIFDVSDANATIVQPGSTDANGWARATIASTRIGETTVRATLPGTSTPIALREGVTVQFVALGGLMADDSNAPAHLDWVASPGQIAADRQEVAFLSLTASQGGVPLSNTAFSLAGLSPNDVLLAGADTTLDANGRWEGQLVGTQAGTRVLRTSVRHVSAQTSVVLTPGAYSTKQSRFEVLGGAGIADGNTPVRLWLYVRDAFGNPLPRQSVAVSSTRNDVQVVPLIGFTDEAGAFAVTATGTDVGTAVLLARVGNVTLYATPHFVAGPPSLATSAVSVLLPAGTTADGQSLVPLMLTARDALAHPVIGAAAKVTSASSADINVVYEDAVTDDNGQMMMAVSSWVVGALPVNVQLASLTLPTSVTFAAGAPNASLSELTLSPYTGVVADGAALTLATAHFVDAFGHPDIDKPVLFSSCDASVTFAAPFGFSDANGMARTTLRSTHANVVEVVATMGALPMTANVTFTAGPVDANHASVRPLHAQVSAGQSLYVTASFADVYGNPLVGAVPLLSATGANNTALDLVAPLDASGQANILFASTTAEAKTIWVSLSGVSLQSNVTVVPAVPDTAISSLIVSPNAGLIADGTAVATCTLTVRDAYGNFVPGAAVTLLSTGSTNLFSNSDGWVQNDGRFVSTLVSTTAETKALTAYVGPASLGAAVTFVAGNPNRLQSTLITSPATGVAADGAASVLATLRVADAFGNLVPNSSVQWRQAGPDVQLSALGGVTAGDGTASVAVTSRNAGPRELIAWTPNFLLTVNANFACPSPARSAPLALPNPPVLYNGGSLFACALDLNADGNVDVAFVSSDATPVLRWTLGAGRGLFAAPSQLSIAACVGATGLVAADLTGDQVPDVAYSGLNTNNLCVVPGNANGSFRAPVTYATDAAPVSLAKGDVNGDGNIDLVVGTAGPGGINVFLRTATGNLAAKKNFPVSGTLVSIAAADINLDGMADVAISTTSPNTIATFRSDAGGNLSLQQTIAVSSVQNKIVLTDMTGDTYPDLLALSASTGALSIFGNQRDSTFAIGSSVPTSAVVGGSMDLFDIDHDGLTDILVPLANVSLSLPLMNKGGGLLQVGTGLWTGHEGGNVTLGHADVNNDGLMDLLVPSPTMGVVLGNGAASLHAPMSWPVVTVNGDLRAADVDGDGALDLIVLEDGGALTWCRGHGTGIFDAAQTISNSFEPGVDLAFPRIKQNLLVEDMDRDGLVDIPLANMQGAMGVFYNDGHAHFTLGTQVALAQNVRTPAIAAADLNGDGNTDLIAPNGNTVAVAWGLGHRLFSAATAYACGGTMTGLTAGDIDGDGVAEVLAISQGDANVYRLQVNGVGGLSTSVAFAGPLNANRIRLRDLNNDGRLDALVFGSAAQTMVRLGTGAGAFAGAMTVNDTANAFVDIEDFNGDGILDLYETAYGARSVQLLLGHGDGTFAAPVTYAGQFTTSAMAAADFDADGRMDLATLGRNTFRLTVGLQRSCLQ